jgi:hypothetical protein
MIGPVRSVRECGTACWSPCRGGQINALDRVQKKAAQFINRMKDSDLETLAQRRTMSRLCALFKALWEKGLESYRAVFPNLCETAAR